jgi:trk system potassium uptake protein TrkA
VVFPGSATDLTVLEQAGLKRADVAVAMTGRDEANLAFCLLARYFGVPRVLARMLNPQYEVPYRLVGATKIHSEADILVGSFLTSIEYPEIGALMPVGKAELVVFELRLPAAAPVNGKTIAEIVRDPDFPRPCLFIGVETATGLDVADGNTVVHGGTTVLMAARRPDLPRVLRCLTDVGPAGDDPDRGRAIQTLSTVPFLSGVAHDDLVELLAGAGFERHKKGATLYAEGQPGDRLYVIVTGSVEAAARGGLPVVLRAPEYFGERTALTGQARTRTIRLLEDAELLAVDGTALRAVVLRNPFLAMELAKALSGPR